MNVKYAVAALLVTAGAASQAATITSNDWSSISAGGDAAALIADHPNWISGNDAVTNAATYSSLSSTNPTAESWQGSIVGVTAPVPEPETYALMLTGLGVVGLLVRRRRA